MLGPRGLHLSHQPNSHQKENERHQLVATFEGFPVSFSLLGAKPPPQARQRSRVAGVFHVLSDASLVGVIDVVHSSRAVH